MSRSGWALACAVAAGVAALVVSRPAAALDQITIGITGPAGAEHGGYYQALAYGIYARKYDLDVTLRQAGSQADLARLLAAGEVDFSAGGSAPEQWGFTERGVPITTIAVIFQKDPLVVFAHPAAGVDGFEDLRGRTAFVPDRARQTVWPWLKRRYGLDDQQERPDAAGLAPFLADRGSVLLGDLTAEGFAIERDGGFEPVVLLPTEDSYYTYTGTVETSWRLVRDRPELVQRFVDATIEGWNNYLYGENAEANALIKLDNPAMSDEQLAFALAALKTHGIVDSGDALTMGIGAMEGGQWVNFVKNTIGWTGPGKPPLDRTYSLQFINQGHGLALKETLTGDQGSADLLAE